MKEFGDLASFAAHVLTLESAIDASMHEGLKTVASLVERDAKDMLGHYQPAAGAFPSWPALAASTEEEKARLGYPADAPLLRDGTLRESITHEVHGMEAVIGSKSEIAEYQEFGTDRIPPRPFIGPAAFSNKSNIQRILGTAVVSGIAGGQHVAAELGYDFTTD